MLEDNCSVSLQELPKVPTFFAVKAAKEMLREMALSAREMALSMLQFIRKLSAMRCIGESYGFSEIREPWNLLNEGCGGEER